MKKFLATGVISLFAVVNAQGTMEASCTNERASVTVFGVEVSQGCEYMPGSYCFIHRPPHVNERETIGINGQTFERTKFDT